MKQAWAKFSTYPHPEVFVRCLNEALHTFQQNTAQSHSVRCVTTKHGCVAIFVVAMFIYRYLYCSCKLEAGHWGQVDSQLDVVCPYKHRTYSSGTNRFVIIRSDCIYIVIKKTPIHCLVAPNFLALILETLF